MKGEMMSSFDITLLVIVIYLAVYGIVNRICKCIEQFAYAKRCSEKMEGNNGKSGIKKSSEIETKENSDL